MQEATAGAVTLDSRPLRKTGKRIPIISEQMQELIKAGILSTERNIISIREIPRDRQ